MKLKIRWADVTPSMAKKWLDEANTHNRNFSPARVALYASDMKGKRWLEDAAQPILFSDKGLLLDGQHRLAAIIESEQTIRFLIIEGVHKSVQLVIDGQRTRSDTDKLRLGKGMNVATRMVSVARAMMNPITSKRKYTTTELGQFISRHQKAIDFALETFAKQQRNVSQALILAVVARATYHTTDLTRLRQFAEVLYSGINRGEKDIPAIQLRNILDEGMANRNTKSFGVFYGKIETALSSFLERKRSNRLTSAEQELFPLPEEDSPINEIKQIINKETA